ncbi:MAG: hypothetical protein OEX02_06050 [Cyclobacteriaceae bacterium]|nr:hypothetical protein [Cyclobacteriaceae bacterium]
MVFFLSGSSYGQKKRNDQTKSCGFVAKDYQAMYSTYLDYGKPLGVQKGERVASV